MKLFLLWGNSAYHKTPINSSIHLSKLSKLFFKGILSHGGYEIYYPKISSLVFVQICKFRLPRSVYISPLDYKKIISQEKGI